MKHAYIQHCGAPRLIVIFAGWGMDERPFAHLSRPGYDIMAVWDYRTLDFDPEWTAGYAEVCVLAWSMGVHAAQMCHSALGPRVTAHIAVGGTPHPVHDRAGIPVDIFTATLHGLDDRSLERFMRRMCGGARAYAEFAPMRPQRPVDELRDELRAIGLRSDGSPAEPRFDHYLLTARDAIFPPEAQRLAFRDCDIVEIDSPHLPPFQDILDGYFIDKTLVAERFNNARTTYDAHAEAQALIADYLANLLHDTDTRAILASGHAEVLEVGCGTGLLSRRILDMKPAARMTYWDIASEAPECIDAARYTSCDAETAIRSVPTASLDMIVSASTAQWFNSPERFVAEAMRTLRPGGILAMSTFGPANMQETAEASGHRLHLAASSVWREAVAGIPDTEQVLITEFAIKCRFCEAMDALRHMSRTGVNAITRHPNGARAIASRLAPDSSGRYTLTYTPLFLVLRKKP